MITKLGSLCTNWNVFLVFLRLWFVVGRGKVLSAPSKLEIKRRTRVRLGRRIIENVFRVLIYVIFVFKMPYYNHKHFSSSILSFFRVSFTSSVRGKSLTLKRLSADRQLTMREREKHFSSHHWWENIYVEIIFLPSRKLTKEKLHFTTFEKLL